MTPCDKFQENLAGEALEEAPSAEFQAHLAACATCRAEAESFRHLAAGFEDLESDPGELFFAAQRKRIHQTVAAETRKSRRWMPALALAAAVLLLFIGFSKWPSEKSSNRAWSTAMLVFTADQGSVTGSGILELETLNPEQLQGLARNIERRILSNQDDELLDEGVDLQDLSRSELDQLIQRLKSKPGERA